MRPPQAPRIDERRTSDFAAELQQRAHSWIPDWGLAEGEHDFGRALLEIAARFNSEVTERLDQAGDKMRRGFLDWLGVRGLAARPARLPVVFKLTSSAREAVLATAPVMLQADADGTPVVFETESDVQLTPARIAMIVATDSVNDAIYVPPTGLSDLEPLEAVPTRWRVKNFAPIGATTLQLEPDTGVSPDMLIEAAGQQYRIAAVENNVVTIEPALETELTPTDVLSKLTVFAPYAPGSRNWQQHVLYLGDVDLLNLDAVATIEVVGANALATGYEWQYWGKRKEDTQIAWQPLQTAAPDEAAGRTDQSLWLIKPEGAMELREIDGKSARWIRALAKTSHQAFSTPEITLRINSIACNAKPICSWDQKVASPTAEGLANTTPLVLQNVFFPLGKEPKQFDSFYLGCQEAFSKTGAKVNLCFEIGDRTFTRLSSVGSGKFANRVLAGVAADRSLHLLELDGAKQTIKRFLNRPPLRPAQPGYDGTTETSSNVALLAGLTWKLPLWVEADDGFSVAVPAGDDIWRWREDPLNGQKSGWLSLGKLPRVEPETAGLDGLVYLAPGAGNARLLALRGGKLFTSDLSDDSSWSPLPTQIATSLVPVDLLSIAPVFSEKAGRVGTSVDDGMIGISPSAELFHVSVDGVCTLIASGISKESGPVAFAIGTELVVCAVKGNAATGEKLVAIRRAGTARHEVEYELGSGVAVISALEGSLSGSTLRVLACIRNGSRDYLMTLSPFLTGDSRDVTEVAITVGSAKGTPIIVGDQVVIPGTSADILIAPFDAAKRFGGDIPSSKIGVGLVMADSTAPRLSLNDLVVRINDDGPHKSTVKDIKNSAGESFYKLDSRFPHDTSGLDAYLVSAPLTGQVKGSKKLKLTADVPEKTWLLIENVFYKVRSVHNLVATFWKKLPPGTDLQYVVPTAVTGRIAPCITLDSSNDAWDAAWLASSEITFFLSGKTQALKAKAFAVNTQNMPEFIVLAGDFEEDPVPDPLPFVVDASLGQWTRVVGDTSANPELSWEYWNGKGWWKLDDVEDHTQNLKVSGPVMFSVPSDIALSDWAGKDNYWIRARLIGGDYGQEKVSVTTKVTGDESVQTVTRSSADINAPTVLRMYIDYHVCKKVLPAYVLTLDSGSMRDQSAANRSAGAVVEAFVPLAVMLAGIENGEKHLITSDPASLSDCDCPDESSTMTPDKNSKAPRPSDSPGTSDSAAASPALFIGIDGPIAGASVNLLMLVKEQNHAAFAPMNVDALVADRFVRITAADATRALSESGLISMAFAVPPTEAGLFGKSLRWLRFTPKLSQDVGQDTDKWSPSLHGVYLNAVWASATETLSRELLGSSDGGPNLSVTLARPPLIHGSLELRVRESLSEEERTAILQAGRDSVLSDVEDLPGDWVLWKQVPDPLDEPSYARVYALDETTGTVQFGDGLHGMIPPIGRDAIVAFRYQRTEPGKPGSSAVPANTILARSPLNLISPVSGVEAAFAADQAAGGAPPESDERVMRFGFARVRHRQRGTTSSDLEDLALQSSPDIVQARVLSRKSGVRLIIVMRGSNPQPSAAQIRELHGVLRGSTSPSLNATGFLRIEGPKVRKLRINLVLQVQLLERTGLLSKLIKDRLTMFFDTAVGGADSNGWPLGVSPTAEDVGLALDDTPYLESIEEVQQIEVLKDGREQIWPERLQATEIAMLAEDPVGIQFKVVKGLV